MITYNNIVLYKGLSFDEYLQLPGVSHSYLKHQKDGIAESFDPTSKMQLGTLVDGILSDPSGGLMEHPLYLSAKDIAAKIKSEFGDLMPFMEKQIAFTADLESEGLYLPTRGRLDFGIKNIGVLDLKITSSKDVDAIIKHFKYEDQVWHYSKGYGVNDAFLMIHSVPLKKTYMRYIPTSSKYNEFWNNQILTFGKAITA